MLGIGSTELVLILFFGFLIFGPEKLPEMGRTVGRAIRQFRAASDEVNSKFKEEVYDPFQEAIDPYKGEIEKTVAPIKEDIDAINSSFRDTKDALSDPLDLKGKKQEMQDREKKIKDTFSFKSPSSEVNTDNSSSPKAAQAKAQAQEAVKAANAAKAKKAAADTNVDDPFADGVAPAAVAAKPAASDDLASLYDFDSEDGE